MTVRSVFADFPLVRTCPPDTLRRVREIDPRADVLYVRPREWWVGHVRPDRARRVDASTTLASLFRIPQKRRGPSWHTKVTVARAKALGFRPVLQHTHNDADGELVEDFRAAVRQLGDDYLAQFDAEQAAEHAALERDLADPGRAREAHRYAFTQSHMPSAPLRPVDRVQAGRVRHVIPSSATG